MQVTLVLPWLNEAEQDIVYPEGVRFQQPADQVPAAGRLALAPALPGLLQSCSKHFIPAISTFVPCRSQVLIYALNHGLMTQPYRGFTVSLQLEQSASLQMRVPVPGPGCPALALSL